VQLNRGCLSASPHALVLVGGVVVADQVHAVLRDLAVEVAQELRNSVCACRGRHCPNTLPSARPASPGGVMAGSGPQAESAEFVSSLLRLGGVMRYRRKKGWEKECRLSLRSAWCEDGCCGGVWEVSL